MRPSPAGAPWGAGTPNASALVSLSVLCLSPCESSDWPLQDEQESDLLCRGLLLLEMD